MARAPERPPTIRDVARVAKVSVSTVSRALDGNSRISESTRERVRATALGLGYRPNRIARSLRTRSASFMGIVVPDIGIGFYSRFAKGAQDLLEHEGYQVLVMNTERTDARELAALRTLREHQVNGVLLATSAGDLPDPPIPTVFFDNLQPGRGVANVACANADGIAMLLEHLAGHGHSRIAYLGGPPDFTSGIERLDGFRAAAARLELDERSRYVELCDTLWSPASAAAAMR
nr:LacI family DNA-binding transcriptional regulator [Gaiellaceae bacterium]